MLDKFKTEGFTDIINDYFKEELKNLQSLIYFKTKSLLVKHDDDLPINEKLNLKFQNDKTKETRRWL